MSNPLNHESWDKYSRENDKGWKLVQLQCKQCELIFLGDRNREREICENCPDCNGESKPWD